MPDDALSFGEEVLALIERDRDEHRARPDLWLIELAEDLWSTSDDQEALDVFLIRLRGAPWWALQVIECLELVVRERPEWAVFNLILGADRDFWLGVDEEAYFAWVAEQVRPMRAAWDAAVGR